MKLGDMISLSCKGRFVVLHSIQGLEPFAKGFALAGISLNMSAFSATFLAEAAYDPRILLPYSHMGERQELVRNHKTQQIAP